MQPFLYYLYQISVNLIHNQKTPVNAAIEFGKTFVQAVKLRIW